MLMGYTDWRDDPGLTSFNVYKKRFAYLSIICEDGTKIWWKNYYSAYTYWVSGNGNKTDDAHPRHKDFIGRISEAEYLVRKLAENL